MKKRMILNLLLAFILLLSQSIVASAATGYEGYAIHRDGAFFGTTWHAGLMDEPYSDDYLPVLHIGGLSGGVKWDSWDNFINGNTFKGVYKPKSGITSSGRDLVKATGRALRTENIGYTPLSQIDYPVSVLGQTWVFTDDISLIRCDGVVEYSYEWNGYRIYGSDDYWDISRATLGHLTHHSLALVTPKTQAQDNMTLVRSTEPVSP
ncbi:hypothetical protein [Abyssisolibacter fermentans]|uniref:hypothetical protein n=1 Tax=Abyssisolibacter fermentans TaxID=1766203 RepID=UPI00082D1757|nr:hypothetical protein [Abyssisolibacter fermentans]